MASEMLKIGELTELPEGLTDKNGKMLPGVIKQLVEQLAGELIAIIDQGDCRKLFTH